MKNTLGKRGEELLEGLPLEEKNKNNKQLKTKEKYFSLF